LGDIGRIQRQQIMMRALMDQTLNLNTIGRLPKILSVIQDHIDTNLTLEEIAALGGFAAKVDRSSVQMLMVPGDFSDPEEYKASYWMPNYERLDAMVADHFDFDLHARGYRSVDPAYVKVAIQDSIEDWEAVERLRGILGDRGYWNVYASTPWHEPLATTRIVAQNGDLDSARSIQEALGFGEVFVESTGSLRSDITIQLGRDWYTRRKHTAATNEETTPEEDLSFDRTLPSESSQVEDFRLQEIPAESSAPLPDYSWDNAYPSSYGSDYGENEGAQSQY
jgi:hypothetical protein